MQNVLGETWQGVLALVGGLKTTFIQVMPDMVACMNPMILYTRSRHARHAEGDEGESRGGNISKPRDDRSSTASVGLSPFHYAGQLAHTCSTSPGDGVK